jgi:hypothetical protein
MTTQTNQFVTEVAELLDSSNYKSPAEAMIGGDLIGEHVLIRPVESDDVFIVYQIGHLKDKDQHLLQEKQLLLNNLKKGYSKGELAFLSASLNLPHEDFSKDTFEISLLNAVRARGLNELFLRLVKKDRPNLTWEIEPEFAKTESIAIIFSATRQPFEEAVEYTGKRVENCQYFLLTNDFLQEDPKEKQLKVDQPWDRHVVTFAKLCAKFRKKTPIHFFFAGPSQLAFMFGCSAGTVYPGDKIYHYQPRSSTEDKYAHVGTITREWKI